VAEVLVDRVRGAAPARLGDLEPRGDLGQLGARRRRLGELGEDELDDGAGDPASGRLLGLDLHPVAAEGRAGGERFGRAGDADQADPAGAEGGLALVEADGRHPAVGGLCGVEERRPGGDLDLDPVDLDRAHADSSGSIARPLMPAPARRGSG